MNKKEINEIINKLLDYSKAFHERYFRAYGQIIMRLDEETYIMSNSNLRLAKLKATDFKLYDINTGDIGKIFNARPDINAMVVMVTEASVKFSNENMVMKPALDDLVQIIGPSVEVAPSGSAVDILLAIKQRRGCFIKGSGLIAVGSNMNEATAGARILEKSAEAEVFADKLGGIRYLPEDKLSYLTGFGSNYSAVNKAGTVPFVNKSEAEFEMRGMLIECGKALERSDLVQGTWGNISMRLDDSHMLITPSGMDYFQIQMEDIVRMDFDSPDYGMQRIPSSEYKLHAGIYKAYPDCNAIIHTHSNGCSVFAAANAGFRIDNPELEEVIGDLHVSEYASPGTDELTESVMTALKDTHACIIANHGAIFYSHSLDLALAIANAVEARACNLLGFGSTLADTEDEEEE